jgi:4-amino-4-deoxy-L-arabinose transferase-like glycosyltransferase
LIEEQASSGDKGRASWPVSITLFFLALIPRLNAIWRGFYTPDEPSWIFRSIRFLQAIESHRWGDTIQTGHPGVVTMWLGTLGILVRRWRDAAGTAAHIEWVSRVPWVTPDNGELFRHLAPFLPPSRLAMALLTALGVVGVYALACRLWGSRLALIGAALLALDPFVVGLSGLLHLDAPTMTFISLSLLAWLAALDSTVGRIGRRSPQGGSPPGSKAHSNLRGPVLLALLSGVCAALGVLSKAPAILSLLTIGFSTPLCFLLLGRPSWQAVKRFALLAATWLLGAVVVLFALFPAMWVDPIGALSRMFGMSDSYFDAPLHIHFFRGVVTPDPGPLFYPLAILFRLTPISFIGMLLSFVPLVTGWRSPEANRRRAFLTSLWVLVVSFTSVMSIGAQKFDRYLLPVFPALDLLAASGWMYVIDSVETALRRSSRADAPTAAFTALLIPLIVAQGVTVLASWPYYLDVYNPLLGGMSGALRTFTVGWGEGMEQVADWLNASPDAGDLTVGIRSPVLLAPLVDGPVRVLDQAARPLADRLVITAGDLQIDPEGVARYTSGAQLIHTVRIGGREAIWVYDVEDAAEEQHLSRYGAPGDLLLCDAPSSFARRSRNWDVELIVDDAEARIVRLLNGWSTSHTRLWYLAYPVASPITSSILRRQLETYAVRLDQVDLGYVTATLYILPDEPAFVVNEETFRSANFGGQIGLVGGTVLESPLAETRLIRFRLRWQALTAPQADYRPFIHLLGARGHLRVAGRGEELLLDRRAWSTAYWSAGDTIEADYAFGIPAGLPPDRYLIAVGLSDAESGGWVPVTDEAGKIRGTTATVLSVDVPPPQDLPDPASLRVLNPTSVDFAGQVRLLGYEHPSRTSVGETIVVELAWLGLAPFAGDEAVRISLVASSGAIAHQQMFPLSVYPTSRWRPGELIDDLYDLKLPAELEGGRYRVNVQVLDEAGVARGAMAQLGSIEVSAQPRLFELPRAPQYPLDLRLGQGIQLVGYDLPQVMVSPGGHVALTLYWRCQAPVDKSYTAFVHLLDDNGQVQGQHDTPPMDGDAPTSGWVVGQVVVDEYAIPVAESAQPGHLTIEVGMYDHKGIIRLPIVDAEGYVFPDDRVLLEPKVTVAQ